MKRSIESALSSEGLADEQRGLLDLVDKLQFAQLDDVKLPQIVVVGDQSAGKSSVLEALTGTPFPRDSGACTRFATEIRMRRAKEASLTVSIIPDKNRPFADQTKLRQYGGTVNQSTPFETMMREAVELIAPKNIPGRFAARDILVVEKRGPDMPLLTLVDLPGLVRVVNREQSETDIQTIEALSDRYMKSPRTIILAVVGGNNDYVQAPILKKARQFDPNGSRTIGVLTKPDLTVGIGLEDKFIELVSNKDLENHFKLGWYVLLNPGPPAPGEEWPSPEDRQAREDAFFASNPKWSVLPPSMCGVGPLRQKLSVQLQRHIGRHVKTLRRQIQEALTRCERQLKDLGPGRDTVGEMRLQMGELFSACNNLVAPAVNGNYKNPPGVTFFPKAATRKGTPAQRLRARVREESERFSRRFRDGGRKFGFSEPPAQGQPGGNGAGLPPAMTGGSSRTKADFAKREVEPLLRQIRGTELPMDSNPRAPYILFQDYSENWPVLAQEYKDNVGVICNEFLAEVIDHVWPSRMRDPLRTHFLGPHVRAMTESADKELKRLVDDMELEVQPFDPEYEERLRAWRVKAAENGAAYTEAEEVLEKMLIYYDLTQRLFTRNVITQVVERHLILGMLRLFNPVQILSMDDAAVESVAAETRAIRERRAQLKVQKKAIEEAKDMCANLAMRSELRGYDSQDEASQDESGEDSDGPTPKRTPPSVRSRQSVQFEDHAPPTPQHSQPRSSQYAYVPQQQQQYSPHQQRPHTPAAPSRMDSSATVRTSDEWHGGNYYSGGDDMPAAPSGAPPPPPRPPKSSDPESVLGHSYYPETPRAPSGQYPRGSESGRERESSKRETMRQRLGMRMG